VQLQISDLESSFEYEQLSNSQQDGNRVPPASKNLLLIKGNRMLGTLSVVPLVLVAILLIACGGGNSTGVVAVTITPTTASLGASQTATFVATVTGSSNTAVTWSVNGVSGGNSTYGTVSASGLYTSPASVITTSTETVTATSVADTTKSASATVTLTPSTQSTTSYVTVTPISAILPAGAQQGFVASVNSAPSNVTWSLACNSTVAGACGTITSGGVYTAPLSPPPGQTVNIIATTVDNSARPGNGTVTIQYSNASLAGRYAFGFSGENGSTPVAAAGSIVFDGAGNITGGNEDVANGGITTTAITGGTYHLGTDGRGTATVTTAGGSISWQFVVASHSRILATTSSSANGTLAGSLDLQDATQFSINAVSGGYALLLQSASASQISSALAEAGSINADGSGTISAGLVDVNVSGGSQTALAATGTYTAPDTNGRGTLTITSTFGTQTFTYYIVDGTALKLLEQSSVRANSGSAVKQAAGPFAATNITGNFATALYGVGTSGPSTLGAQFNLDGKGGVTATIDSNINGNPQSNVKVTGTYTVTDATTGRTTITLNGTGQTFTLVAYPAANQGLSIAEMDTTIAAGSGYAQQSFVLNSASLAGTFASQLEGTSLGTPPGFEVGTGFLALNGGSAITGTLDLILSGTAAPSTAVSGSYLLDQTGRITVSLTTPSSIFSTATLTSYPIDPQHFLMMETDSNRVLVSFSQKQF